MKKYCRVCRVTNAAASPPHWHTLYDNLLDLKLPGLPRPRQLCHQLCVADWGLHQQRVLAHERFLEQCFDLLHLDLIRAVFGFVEGGSAVCVEC
jgi:hypothetical protein